MRQTARSWPSSDGITNRRDKMTDEERVEAEARAKYNRAIAEAKAEYDRIDAEAWAEYRRVITAPSYGKYKRVTGSARAEYKRAIAQAEAEYKRAITEAEKHRSVYAKIASVAMQKFRDAMDQHPGSGIAAQRIRKQAQTEYDQAIAQALAKYKRVTGEDYA